MLNKKAQLHQILLDITPFPYDPMPTAAIRTLIVQITPYTVRKFTIDLQKITACPRSKVAKQKQAYILETKLF